MFRPISSCIALALGATFVTASAAQATSLSCSIYLINTIGFEQWATTDIAQDYFAGGGTEAQAQFEYTACAQYEQRTIDKVYFEAVAETVTVTGPDSLLPGATLPSTVGLVGQRASGVVEYYSDYNFFAEDLTDYEALADLSYEEIDALLPGGLYGLRNIQATFDGITTSSFYYTGNRSAEAIELMSAGAPLVLPGFQPVAVANNSPGSGDGFVTGGFGGQYIYPTGLLGDIANSYVEAGIWLSDACPDLDPTQNSFIGLSNGLRDLARLETASVIGLEVTDNRPTPETATLLPGTGRTIDQAIYPALAGAVTNRFTLTYLQVGTAGQTWGGLGGLPDVSTCQDALNLVPSLGLPTDLSDYLPPVQSIQVTGRITYLGDVPGTGELSVPLPAGLPLAAAGLGALLCLRRRVG